MHTAASYNCLIKRNATHVSVKIFDDISLFAIAMKKDRFSAGCLLLNNTDGTNLSLLEKDIPDIDWCAMVQLSTGVRAVLSLTAFDCIQKTVQRWPNKNLTVDYIPTRTYLEGLPKTNFIKLHTTCVTTSSRSHNLKRRKIDFHSYKHPIEHPARRW
jgi:hypothetical protein